MSIPISAAQISALHILTRGMPDSMPMFLQYDVAANTLTLQIVFPMLSEEVRVVIHDDGSDTYKLSTENGESCTTPS